MYLMLQIDSIVQEQRDQLALEQESQTTFESLFSQVCPDCCHRHGTLLLTASAFPQLTALKSGLESLAKACCDENDALWKAAEKACVFHDCSSQQHCRW